MTTPVVTTIQTSRLNHCVARAGTGPGLLFIGGTGWDIREDSAPFGSPLPEHYDILHFDQRGMGQSEKPPGPYTMIDYADDAAALLDSVGWSECLVFGFSFGGMVAQELSIKYPQRVKAMALVSTTAGGAGGGSAPIHEFADWPPYERAKKALETSDLRFSREFQTSHPVQASEMIASRMPANPEYMEEPNALAGRNAQLMARAEHDCFDRLSNIQCPVIVIGGESDGQAPSDAVRNLAHGIPDSELLLLPGAHGLIFENNSAYEYVIRFFDSYKKPSNQPTAIK